MWLLSTAHPKETIVWPHSLGCMMRAKIYHNLMIFVALNNTAQQQSCIFNYDFTTWLFYYLDF